MTDFEKDYLKKSKDKDFDLDLEDIEVIRKELDDADASALIAVFALRSALRQVKSEEVEPQALWRFIRYLTEIEMPMRIIDLTGVLYPGNEAYYSKALTPTAFKIIQRQATLMIEAEKYDSEEHKKWLEDISNGKLPYGYSIQVREEKENEQE